jgi:hypothetical protein
LDWLYSVGLKNKRESCRFGYHQSCGIAYDET